MQIIKSLRWLFIFLAPAGLQAQSTYLMPGTKDYIFLNRLEIQSANPELNFSTVKPFNRRRIVAAVEQADSLIAAGSAGAPNLSAVDRYNMERFLMNNSEWSAPKPSYYSDKPILKEFYKTKGNFYELKTKDFFLAANPVFQYQQSKELDNDQNIFLNSRGLSFRGLIDGKVGFSLYLTENQERAPRYVQQWIARRRAVPGAGFYKTFKDPGGTDYFDIRGSVTWNVGRHIDMQFGYDRNFIGAGYRSLFLSDFSNNALFLKINTRIWKFNYENLFMELTPDFQQTGGNLLPRKYFRMNHLSYNVNRWLNVGIFDAVMFGRKDHFDFLYMVPVLFLRAAEQQKGSPDNAFVGFDAKANIAKKVQVYGQFIFDEFKLNELRADRGWWANKYGYQAGLKWIDVAGIRNLDLQVESNRVRPFTYSHFDSIASYTHYNQPFAHPLGANFQEYVGILHFQPFNRLYLQAKLIYYKQGLDKNGENFGADPFRNYRTRTGNYGYEVGTGNKATCLNANFLASYELRENLFIDANAQRRTFDSEIGTDQATTVLSVGLRLNMARRVFDF